MGSNSSSIVISFSIAILLLLIILLLLSYNSKSKNDSVERFEGVTDSPSSILGSSLSSFNNIMDPAINKYTTINSTTDTNINPKSKNSVASNDIYAPKEKFANMIEGSPIEDNYTLLNGTDNSSLSNSSSYQDPTTCFKRDKLTATDLLPSDASNKWSQINPSSSGELADQNFLTAGYHIGVNTIGQSMRNANLQLRSEIPNPQVAVSPWLISTIEPDIRPVSFEIGSAPTTPPS